MTPAEIQALHDAGTTQRQLAKLLGKSTADISPYLKSIGIVTRKRGGNWRRCQIARTASQIVNSAESRANGDAAVRARWTPRKPCPWGLGVQCVLADEALTSPMVDCARCLFSRSAEGRVSVVSSFGREAVVQGGMR